MSIAIIALVAFLGIVALVQVVKVFEVSSDINKGKENDVTDKDNRTQGALMLAFMVLFLGGFIWMMLEWGDVLLPKAASIEGAKTDTLMWISMGLIGFVFFVTQPILFYFSWKYQGSKNRQATYYAHNNRLEALWTIVPALALATLIIYGLTTWIDIMNPEHDEEPLVVELYARQFDWHARVAGADNKLGYANVRFVEGANVLGVDPSDEKGKDDIVVRELYLPVNRPVLFKFRAQDVIHSAYMPHFRAQMNCVPGAITQFSFTPTITTEEMRQRPEVMETVSEIDGIRKGMGEEGYEFDYVLLCNKICGAAHYNMQMRIVVVTEEEYQQWLKEQKTFAESM